MQAKYQHLFFDLDHTLWDFEKNSKQALVELYRNYDWEQTLDLPVEEFLKTYYQKNDEMWALYREHKIDKATLRHRRFAESFSKYGYGHDEKVESFESDYIAMAPLNTTLFPGCIEMLSILEEHFTMHIITNGFEESQHIKMEKSGLTPFFQHIITSDKIGVNKPDPKIFIEAMRLAGAKKETSLMIGDNLHADILGARRVGIDQVFFNPKQDQHEEEVSYEIKDLMELPPLLL
jgi:putative hydrolase of the HAD superfamily